MTLEEYFQNKSSLYDTEQRILRAWAKKRGFDMTEINGISVREDPCGGRDMIQLCANDCFSRYRTETFHKSVIERWLKE